MHGENLTRRGFVRTAARAGLGGLALSIFSLEGKADDKAASRPNLSQNGQTAQGAVDCGSCVDGCAQQSEAWKSASDQPPRKIIVGTMMQAFWGKYPGLDKRLQKLTGIVDQLQAQSQKSYGRGLDLAVFPEMAVTGPEQARDVAERAFPLEGLVQGTFARKARQHHCYIVVPLNLLEDKATKRCSNAAVLFGRRCSIAILASSGSRSVTT